MADRENGDRRSTCQATLTNESLSRHMLAISDLMVEVFSHVISGKPCVGRQIMRFIVNTKRIGRKIMMK